MPAQRKKQRAPFTAQLSKPKKARTGRTQASQTPLNVRTSGVTIDDATRDRVRERFGRKLGKFALHIERGTVRFEDVNGPRGGVDIVCRIKVVLSNLPSVLVEESGATAAEAFDGAVDRVERAVRRALARSDMSSPKVARKQGRKARAGAAGRSGAGDFEGSLIGRRVGRSSTRLEMAADRPEKRRGNVPIDTAQPGQSASDRRVGAGATAKRNTKLNEAGLTATLEDSQQERPSRKSTRGSANRSKRDSNLKRRETRRVSSPKARARRAAAKAKR